MVRTAGGALAAGRTLPGRGAWLCDTDSRECLEAAIRRRAFGRALRAEVGPEAAASLRGLLAERARMDNGGRTGRGTDITCN